MKLRIYAKNVKVSFYIDDDLNQELNNLDRLISQAAEVKSRAKYYQEQYPHVRHDVLIQIESLAHSIAYLDKGYSLRIQQRNEYGTQAQFYAMLETYLNAMYETTSYNVEDLRKYISKNTGWFEPISIPYLEEANEMIIDLGFIFGAIHETIDNIRAIINIPIDVEEPEYSPA